MNDTVNISRLSRVAAIAPASINVAARTVDVVWTTGAKVRRFDWLEGEYEEELEVSEKAVDLTRLNNGAPLLADHDIYEIDSVHGVVERAWLENGEGRATVRFSEDPDSDKIWKKVVERVIRNVSVGYNVNVFQEIIEAGRRILRAISWEPLEISLVAVGADASAQIRSTENKTHSCVVKRASTQTGGLTMLIDKNKRSADADAPAAEPADTAATPAAAEPAPAAEPAAEPAAAAAQERSMEIMQLCQLAGADLKRAMEFANGSMTVAQVRALLINERAAKSPEEISTQQKPATAPASASRTASRMEKRFKKA